MDMVLDDDLLLLLKQYKHLNETKRMPPGKAVDSLL